VVELTVEEEYKDHEEEQVEDERGQEEERDLPSHEFVYALL
jgi:hypothetical protein